MIRAFWWAPAKKTGALALFRDGRIVFVDPKNMDGGSIYKPTRDPLLYFLDSTDRTRPTLAPPTVLDHPPLPPWLRDPSPPGFQVSPNQPPPIFDWDRPDPSSPATHTPASEPPHGPVISLPPLHDAGKAGLGLLAAVGGLMALLAHPGQGATPTP